MIDCTDCTVPTDNPGGVCSFCLDYVPPSQRLDITHRSWLTAHGDTSRVELFRSPLIKTQSRRFGPVLDYIAAHGLELAYTETDEDNEWMLGQRIREIYV